ncbi:hypothetical protein S245_056244, partial [Arachis hypogaea]
TTAVVAGVTAVDEVAAAAMVVEKSKAAMGPVVIVEIATSEEADAEVGTAGFVAAKAATTM